MKRTSGTIEQFEVLWNDPRVSEPLRRASMGSEAVAQVLTAIPGVPAGTLTKLGVASGAGAAALSARATGHPATADAIARFGNQKLFLAATYPVPILGTSMSIYAVMSDHEQGERIRRESIPEVRARSAIRT